MLVLAPLIALPLLLKKLSTLMAASLSTRAISDSSVFCRSQSFSSSESLLSRSNTENQSSKTRVALKLSASLIPLGSSVDLDRVAATTAGYSGAELAALTREAALAALEEASPSAGGEEDAATPTLPSSSSTSSAPLTVEARHLEAAQRVVTPRTSEETLAFFEAYERRVKRG